MASQINSDSALNGLGVFATATSTSIKITSAWATSTNYYLSLNVGATETASIRPQNNVVVSAGIGGSPTASDSVTLTAIDPALSSGTQSVSYTVAGGDTLSSIASSLASAVNGNSQLQAAGISAVASGTLVLISSASQNVTTYSSAVSSGATETVSLVTNAATTKVATVGGSRTTGDKISISAYSPLLADGSETVTYTAQSSDTLSSIATSLASAIGADADMTGIGLSASSVGPHVLVNWLSTNAATYTASLSGGATETLSLTPTSNGFTNATVGGSPTVSDVLSVTVHHPALPGGQKVISYTVQAGDSLTSIATGLAAAINASTDLQLAGISGSNSSSATLCWSEKFSGDSGMSAGTTSTTLTILDGSNDQVSGTYQSNIVGNGGSTSLTYDANGNMTSDGTNTYSWDAENRLVQITYPGTGNNSQFVYDPSSRCVKIVETTSGTVTSTKQFVWAGSQRCEVRDGSGNLLNQYFGLGQVNFSGSTNSFYYTKDPLGSVREITDAIGNIQSQFEYDPYGRVSQISGSGATPDFGYAGMYQHARSRLSLTIFRAYNPNSGQWLSRDPVGERMGTNLYAYLNADPIRSIDPFGLGDNSTPYGAGAMTAENWSAVKMNMTTADLMSRGDGALFNWANSVKGGGDWDYAGAAAKAAGVQMAPESAIAMGNINYAATGTILGIPPAVLHAAGGSDQIVSGIVNSARGHNTIDWNWVISPTYGDRPADYKYIDIGIQLGKAWLENHNLDPLEWLREHYPQSSYPEMYPGCKK